VYVSACFYLSMYVKVCVNVCMRLCIFMYTISGSDFPASFLNPIFFLIVDNLNFVFVFSFGYLCMYN